MLSWRANSTQHQPPPTRCQLTCLPREQQPLVNRHNKPQQASRTPCHATPRSHHMQCRRTCVETVLLAKQVARDGGKHKGQCVCHGHHHREVVRPQQHPEHQRAALVECIGDKKLQTNTVGVGNLIYARGKAPARRAVTPVRTRQFATVFQNHTTAPFTRPRATPLAREDDFVVSAATSICVSPSLPPGSLRLLSSHAFFRKGFVQPHNAATVITPNSASANSQTRTSKAET